MSLMKNSQLSTGRDGERGQSLYIVAGLLLLLLGAAAFVVDLGSVMHKQRELQASADVAAAAGAADLPNGTQAVSDATLYSALSGNKNVFPDLPNVTFPTGYPELLCLNTLSTDENMSCEPPSNANALQVKEQVSVPLYFGKIFGINTIQLTATATASMRGGVPHPLNVIIIMDTTESMQDLDPNCTVAGISSPGEEDCAKQGVRTLLGQLWPCAPNLTNCGPASSGNVASPVDMVGLMVFPGLSSSSYDPWDYTNCQANKLSTSAGIVPYAATTEYEIIPPSSDYRVSANATSLNPASHLVAAVDFADEGCTPTGSGTLGGYGLEDPGGEHTYYAGAIYEAQAVFPQVGSRANIQNVIILLSDGAANATGTDIQAGGNVSATQECHQGITAAVAAAQAGTWVYTIAYNSNNSIGGSNPCTTDTNPTISPCAAMQNMANSPGNYPDPTKFYADGNSAANGCVSADHPSITSLDDIFKAIGEDLLTTALIPNNTT